MKIRTLVNVVSYAYLGLSAVSIVGVYFRRQYQKGKIDGMNSVEDLSKNKFLKEMDELTKDLREKGVNV